MGVATTPDRYSAQCLIASVYSLLSPVGWVQRSVTHRAIGSAVKRICARIWITFVTTRSSTVIVNERRTGHIRDFIDMWPWVYLQRIGPDWQVRISWMIGESDGLRCASPILRAIRSSSARCNPYILKGGAFPPPF